jgi:hypothetical protein
VAIVHHVFSIPRFGVEHELFKETKNTFSDCYIKVTHRRKQTNKQTNKQTRKPTDKQTNRQTNQKTNKPANQQTNKQTNKPAQGRIQESKKGWAGKLLPDRKRVCKFFILPSLKKVHLLKVSPPLNPPLQQTNKPTNQQTSKPVNHKQITSEQANRQTSNSSST